METPIRRRVAAKQFVAAMQLVLETVDDAIATESDGRTVQEILVLERVQTAAKGFYHAPGRKQRVVDLAQKIVERLPAVEAVLLGTGVCE
ncbi:MAG: hypothetical protein JNK57_20540, partial [Planctomycetaceae bacterium]|nr:hypothetical protein [Planctomycetaceae bacterium]